MTWYQKLVETVDKVEKRYPNHYLLLHPKSLRVIAKAKSLTNRTFRKVARETDGCIITSGKNMQKKYFDIACGNPILTKIVKSK